MIKMRLVFLPVSCSFSLSFCKNENKWCESIYPVVIEIPAIKFVFHMFFFRYWFDSSFFFLFCCETKNRPISHYEIILQTLNHRIADKDSLHRLQFIPFMPFMLTLVIECLFQSPNAIVQGAQQQQIRNIRIFVTLALMMYFDGINIFRFGQKSV